MRRRFAQRGFDNQPPIRTDVGCNGRIAQIEPRAGFVAGRGANLHGDAVGEGEAGVAASNPIGRRGGAPLDGNANVAWIALFIGGVNAAVEHDGVVEVAERVVLEPPHGLGVQDHLRPMPVAHHEFDEFAADLDLACHSDGVGAGDAQCPQHHGFAQLVFPGDVGIDRQPAVLPVRLATGQVAGQVAKLQPFLAVGGVEVSVEEVGGSLFKPGVQPGRRLCVEGSGGLVAVEGVELVGPKLPEARRVPAFGAVVGDGQHAVAAYPPSEIDAGVDAARGVLERPDRIRIEQLAGVFVALGAERPLDDTHRHQGMQMREEADRSVGSVERGVYGDRAGTGDIRRHEVDARTVAKYRLHTGHGVVHVVRDKSTARGAQRGHDRVGTRQSVSVEQSDAERQPGPAIGDPRFRGGDD